MEGFAGGFSCGATLSGLKLIAKRENAAGFGVPLMEANRAFLGDGWQTQMSDPKDWEPVRADIAIGNPPCSGFSNFSAGTSVGIGADSPINECMWDMMRYAAKCRPAIVIMESVGQAFSKGQVLMHKLAQLLNERSGLAYRTTHVLQDNYSVGGSTLRRRYFLVLSQVPFGVERHEATWLPTVSDALSDLRSLAISWDMQQYTLPPTWWSLQLRSASGYTDGHDVLPVPHLERLASLQREDVVWEPGDRETEMLKKHYARFGVLPESYDYESHAAATRHLTRGKHLLERNLETGGFGQSRCWDWREPGRVITGHGPYQVWHPDNRSITHRETARLLGFPDDWHCGAENLRTLKPMHQFWGKGTSVAPAQWITTWARESLDGNPGSVTGDPLADGSVLIDVSGDWKRTARKLGLHARFGLPPDKPRKTVQLPRYDPAPEPLPVESILEDEVTEHIPPAPVPAPEQAPDPAPVTETVTAAPGRYPGWEYDRDPAKGPVWDTALLDKLVHAAEEHVGADAKPGKIATLINSKKFRHKHAKLGAEDARGCAPYHVTQSRGRRSEPQTV